MKKRVLPFLIILITLSANLSCSNKNTIPENPLIYLIGETHSQPEIIKRELELWQHYYKDEGFRHFFLEVGYCQGLILNEWMKSDSNELLARMFEDLKGTAFYTQEEIDFFKEIKRTCPGTIFHGTDVGHQFETTGTWYLERMGKKELQNTEDYKLVIENNQQAVKFYEKQDANLREKYMAENFIREYNKLPEGTKIMGVYGSAHTGINSKNITGRVDSMAKQINKYYKKARNSQLIYTQDLSEIQSEKEPVSVTTVTIGDKEYKASYFGKSNLKGLVKGYNSREFYRIESDKEDFNKSKTTYDYLPYNNFPTAIHLNDVYLIIYEKENGSIKKKLYRANGKRINNKTVLNNISVKF